MTVTVATSVTWAIAAVSLLKAIDCELEFANQPMDNAGVMKHFQEVAWLFREKGFATAISSFYTDLSGGYSETTMVGGFGSDLWGGFEWGVPPWGGIQRPKPIRCIVTRDQSRGSLLSIRIKVRNAYAQWSLNGVSVQYDFTSERMVRD